MWNSVKNTFTVLMTFSTLVFLASTVEVQARTPASNDIHGIKILYEASNHLEIEVSYSYTGDYGALAWMAPSLFTEHGNRHPADGASRPGPITPGRGTTWVRLYFDAPPFGRRPTGANQIKMTMYSDEEQPEHFYEEFLPWFSRFALSPQEKPKLLRAVTAAGVEETRPGRRPVRWGGGPAAAQAQTFSGQGKERPRVCVYLVFEDVGGTHLVQVTAHRNGRYHSTQRHHFMAPTPDTSYTAYDATHSLYFCERRIEGRWQEFILLDGKHLGDVRYRVEGAAQADEGSCSIAGRATGARADAARVFSVSLYGPDDPKTLRASSPFGPSGSYRFDNLPDGGYRIVVRTRADIPVRPHPPESFVKCRPNMKQRVDFEFR